MIDRYHRQILLPQLGAEGQNRLSASRTLLIGCGALGTVIAEQLTRAGISSLKIADRDIVELTNLQRQTLFDEFDAKAGLPKSIAAARRLGAINSGVQLDPQVIDVHSENIERLCENIDLILDGTDNAQIRYLINDVSIKHNIPWVYGACVGTTGRVMGILPGVSPCLRCMFPDPPGPGELQTCDTAGVLGAVSGFTASLQVVEAMKILVQDPTAGTTFISLDAWPTRIHSISTNDARVPDCPTCGQRNFEFLNRKDPSAATTLCGRDTVQVRAQAGQTIDLSTLAQRMAAVGIVQSSAYFVRCALHDRDLTVTVFPDGRALVHGTSDTALARSIYAKFIGS